MKTQLKPILKWVGGKRQLLDRIIPLIPKYFNTYFEPFAGGLAVLLALQPNKAIINDLNTDLIYFYVDVKNEPDKLIGYIKEFKNEKEEFYKIRSMDRSKNYSSIDSVLKSARFYYLNKTAYNGLYRVNSSGFFNAPYGSYKTFSIDEYNLKQVCIYFRRHDVKFYSTSYEKILRKAKEGDFVYLDPPYFDTFTQYTKGQFGKDEQIKLKEWCDKLNKRGVKFLLSKYVLLGKKIKEHIRIECKWQQSAGSVDEKFPYMYLNAVQKYPENIIFFVVDGSGYKKGSREWIEKRIKENWLNDKGKTIKLFYLSEIIKFINTNFKD